MPDPFEALLLGIAAWRTWHLVANDDITERPRRYITRSKWVKDLVECPYCLGFWVALAWAVSFAVFPTETVWVALPFALNAVVIVVAWLLSDR